MLTDFQIIFFTYAALFPILNPLSGAMMFLNFTHGLPSANLNKLAKKVSINTFVLLVAVLITGSWVLNFFGITVPIVQVCGGLVVASFAWQMLHQPVNAKKEVHMDYSDKALSDMAFFPLTMPLTAGPGCIAVTLTLGAQVQGKLIEVVVNQFLVAVGILLAALTVWVLYRYAETITKKLGENGSMVIMRLSAFVNFCVGLQIVWNGIKGLMS